MSADGSRAFAAEEGGLLYTSSDYGATWTAQSAVGTKPWTSLACSSDGSFLIAGTDGQKVFESHDYGVTWTPRESARSWRGVAMNSDGTRLFGAPYGGQLYVYNVQILKQTTEGTAGWLSGEKSSALEVQYVGGDTFMTLSHEGSLTGR